MTIAPTGSFTFVSGILQGREAPLAAALHVVVGAILGMITGRRLAPLISGPALQKGFALTAGLIALAIAIKAVSRP